MSSIGGAGDRSAGGAARSLVLVLDRLGAGWLGPYGNTWLETPAFDRLAADSLLFETMIAGAGRLDRVYGGYWGGQAVWSPRETLESRRLPQRLLEAGVATTLITDEPLVAALPGAAEFHRHCVLANSVEERSAGDLAETQLAQWFAQVIATVQDTRPGCVWAHARALQGMWDAPLMYRQQLAEEEDPPPHRDVAPPEQTLPPDVDPDYVLGWQQACGGQVSLVDRCLETLLEAVALDDLLLVVVSPRGYPLGEHGRLGDCDRALYSELLHVPLLVRFPDGQNAACRTARVVQEAEIYRLLCRWHGLELEGPSDSEEGRFEAPLRWPKERQLAMAREADSWTLRTAAWHLRTWIADTGVRAAELFAKPDDRWERNDVADRRPDIVELGVAFAEGLLQRAAGDESFDLSDAEAPEALAESAE